EALRRELLHRGIAVYAACPSDIDTPQFRAEQDAMPAWMQVAGARGKAMPPDIAAARILSRCKGKRFLILINAELHFLLLLKRVLPERALNFILERMFPLPPAEERRATDVASD